MANYSREFKVKNNIEAPCGPFFYTEGGRTFPMYPTVDCNLACHVCPWNPEEQTRRLKKSRKLPGLAYTKKDGVPTKAYQVTRLVFRKAERK